MLFLPALALLQAVPRYSIQLSYGSSGVPYSAVAATVTATNLSGAFCAIFEC
jgi:hypothetical protein